MKDVLYNFINNHHFTYGVNDKDFKLIDELSSELESNNINISYDTLKLIYNNCNIVKQFIFDIKLLYLNNVNQDNPVLSEQTYFNIFWTMHYHDDHNIDSYFKLIFKSFRELNIDYFIDSKKKAIYAIIYKYYWLNRFDIEYDDLIRVLQEINHTNNEVFYLNGISDDKGNIIVNHDELYDFLKSLFRRGLVIK